MIRTSLWAMASLLAIGAATATAANNRGPDLPDDKPRLVLTTGGHTNQVRALVFSHDGQRLYSGGLDKIVLGWELRERARRRLDASLVQKLHWEISRGMRGAIVELAMSEGEDRLLAMGGFSTRGQGGDITVYDSATAQVRLTLRDLQGSLATGGLAFSPDGSKLAAVSVYGDTWLWSGPDFSAAPRQLRSIEARGEKMVDRPYRALTFLDNHTLVLAVPIGDPNGDQWGLEFYDVRRAVAGRLLRADAAPFAHRGAVTAIVRDRTSRTWATADKSGAVYLWRGTEDQQPTLLRQGREALDVAFGPGRSLFVATRLQRQPGVIVGVESAYLEHWTTEPLAKVNEVSTSTSLDNYACAVSPDGKWLAACGDDRKPVQVFALRDANDQPLKDPLAERNRPLALRGVGTALGKVAFVETRDGAYQIGFGPAERSGEAEQFNNYGPIAQAFDLTRGALLPEDKLPTRFLAPEDTVGHWKAIAVDNRKKLLLTCDTPRREHFECTITLDPSTQGEAMSYCFLGDRQQTFAIAVGTNNQNGIFIYQLVRSGECPLLRYYRDHAYVVTSLSVSQDGAYLASASLDQTIKLWSLEGLRSWDEISAAKNGGFRQAVAWGATFALRDGQVVVSQVKKSGIAFARGLRDGDVVTRIQKVEGGAAREFTQANDLLAVLERTTVFEQLGVWINDRQLPQKVQPPDQWKLLPAIVPAWEPVATLFVDRRGEWALFTPQGPYHASVNGDQLFGWQFNLGGDVTPEFRKAEELRKLEQPDQLRKLFAAGPGALDLIYAEISDLVTRDTLARQVSRSAPSVRLLAPKDAAAFLDGQEFAVTAEVFYPTAGADAASRYEVLGSLNGASLGDPAERKKKLGGETVTWRVRNTEAYNRLMVRVAERDAPPGAPFGDVAVNFRGKPPQSRPSLHMLVLAADEYSGALKLDFPVKDAKALVEDLNRFSVALYKPGKTVALHNNISKEATPQAIAAACQELKQTARPDDLLVVYIAGHGSAFGGQYYFVPPHPDLKNLEEGEQKIVERIGVPWKALLQLRDVPCRKLVLVDTCHSGNAILQADSLGQQKAFTHPLRDAQMLVVSATGVNQFAKEVKGEGVFTKCVREAITTTSADGLAEEGNEGANPPDGEVTVMELVRYVTREVPRRTRTIGMQTPNQSPESLFKELHIPLAAYRFVPPANAQTATAP